MKKFVKSLATLALSASSLLGLTANAQVDVQEALPQEPTGVELVLVTNNSGLGRDERVQELVEAAGFNVTIVGLGGADVTARVIAEVENPTTNVVWGPTQFNFDDMIEAKALIEWQPEWVDAVADFDRNNGFSYPYETQPKFWVANADTLDALPTSVNELWENEAFHGQYTIPDNFGGTTNRAIVASILGQYLDPEGELGVSQEGWDAMQAFLDNGVRTPEGEDKYARMADGTTPITYDGASNVIANINSLETDANLETLYFQEGQPSNVNEIGVVNNADEEVLVESIRLANYLGSAEFMGQFSADFNNLVTNADAVDSMPEVSAEIFANFTEQELDWETINDLLDEWIVKIELEML